MFENKRKKRKRPWTPKEEELLIDIWKSKISKLRGVRRNGHIMEEINDELEKNDCNVSVQETKYKIHNLTTRYVKEKSIYKQTGSPSKWTLYSKLNIFLGRFNNSEESIIEEIIDSDDCSFDNVNSKTSQACSKRSAIHANNNSKLDEFVICRSCVAECTNFKSLNKIGLLKGEKTTLATLLSFCTNLEFSDHESTNLPSVICTNCILDLTKSYLFIKKVQEADKLFRGQLITNNINENNGVQEEQCRVKVENELVFNNTVIKSELPDTNEYTKVKDSTTYILPDEIYENCITKEETQLQENEEIKVKAEIEDCDIQKTYKDLTPGKQYDLENKINHLEISPNKQDNCVVDCAVKRNPNGIHFFTCKVCSKQFRNKYHFLCHIQIQPDNTPYKCCVCGGSFRTICVFGGNKAKYLPNISSIRKDSKFKGHLKIHSSTMETFICHICGKQFSRMLGFKIHMLIHKIEKRSRKKSYSCNNCSIAYSTYKKLWSHRNIHSGLKKFKCSKCFKRFSKTQQLEHHMLDHTKQTLFNCQICSQSFKSKSSLLIHMRIHKEIVIT